MNSQQIINLVVGIFFLIIILVVALFVFNPTLRAAVRSPGELLNSLKNISTIQKGQQKSVSFDEYSLHNSEGGKREKPKRKNPKRRR